MRLIDADELEKVMTQDWFLEILATAESKRDLEHKITNMIDSVPLAYDVEKVVAELKQQEEQYNRRALELVDKSTEAGIHNKGKACSYAHAIEIVRNGGKEQI